MVGSGHYLVADVSQWLQQEGLKLERGCQCQILESIIFDIGWVVFYKFYTMNHFGIMFAVDCVT